MEIFSKIVGVDTVLIRLKGRLDAASGADVKATFQKFLQQGCSNIIVDFREVPFVDSSGLVALVSGLRLAREKKGQLVLSNILPQVQTVFRLTMLDRIFPIHPTSEDAKRSLV